MKMKNVVKRIYGGGIYLSPFAGNGDGNPRRDGNGSTG